ncbi:hypothetical protein CONLIGDRAFT_150760 [Coniochaeta ligniaria NRRL 30616]|uniref:BTB domain-containing protein n=1 Tax=Coniochaeta ligniaria NRRL 30616 TaxID=1408157 RepID=A0A1J7I5U5_9PEZI|nr:hypothetical protein CONLIGDRAFT_150760 [Coniochaeta ligniaria NRRL 30616]
MSKVYEVDPEADTLIIISGAQQAPATNGTVVPSKRPRKSDVHVVNGVDNNQPDDLRIKASSKHLSLASRPLRNKLSTANGNSPTVQYDGRVHLRIEGYDPAAVTIVLNALHGKSSRVPKSLDLETIAKVASFVQAFQCHEAVEAYAERWISRLKTPPTKYTSETASWIFVSYVFQQPDLFRAATRTAISQGPALPVGQSLRIPGTVTSKRYSPESHALPLTAVTDAIEARRQQLVGKVVSVIHSLVAELKDGTVFCTQGCDLLLLGSLVKALHQWDLSEPYTGVSFEAITRSLRELQDQVWYVGAPFPRNPNGADKAPSSSTPVREERKERFAAHYCGIRGLVNPKLYSLEVSVDGLDLDDILAG